MDSKKITSWLNWNEWKSVVDDAYNFSDREAMRRAFTRILAWESRDSNLPAAILCLKELLIAKLRQPDSEGASIDEVYGYKSCLAMNMVRFVNFITEPYQTSIYAKPIKTIANEIGLPDWIVNLRHNATHYSLPSLEILESAREFLFAWLKENYINSYKEIGFEPAILENMKVYFHDLFVKYVNISYKKFLTKKAKQDAPLDQEYQRLDQEIQDLTWHFRNEAFDIVLQDGFLVPTKNEMNAMGLIAEEFLEQNNLELPKQFIRIWTSFLTHCNDASLTSLLFQKLLNSNKLDFEAHKLLEQNQSGFPSSRTSANLAVNTRSLRAYFLLAWIVHLLKNNSYKMPEKQKNAKFYFEFNVKETFLTLFESISNNMGLLLVNELARIPIFMKEIGQAKLEKIAQLVMIMAESSNDAQIDDVGLIGQDRMMDDYEDHDQDAYFNDLISRHSRSNMVPDTKEYPFKTKAIRAHLLSQSDWKQIDDPSWNSENTKIGLLDGQTYSNLNLDLRQFLAAQEDTKPGDNSQLDASLASNAMNASRSQLNSAPKSLRNAESDTHFFNVSKPSELFVDRFKNALINNYWEN